MTKLQQCEVAMLIDQLSYEDEKEQLRVFEKLIALDSENVDISTAYIPMLNVIPRYDHHQYTRFLRFVGILNDRYKDPVKGISERVISFLITTYEIVGPLAKGLIVKQIANLINEHNIEQLIPIIMRACSSDDPYIRKSVALGILHIAQTKQSLIDKYKLGTQIKRLVEDGNPNVAANAIAALMEINEMREKTLLDPSLLLINNLLASIDQTSEWGQIVILDFTSTFVPDTEAIARSIISRVSSRLSHINSGVVLSAVRCCLTMNQFVDDNSKIMETLTRIALPLLSLMNNTAPIQYTTVKSILVLLQNYRRMFSSEVSLFFCKFDDPLYMKLAKLDVIMALCNPENVSRVLVELYDYAQQTDVEFVRKSISAIGRIAVNFESAAGACVDRIVALVKTKVQYIIQECIVAAVDIFRRYPMTYLGIVGELCGSLEGQMDDHRAKAGMVWILGEYAERIGNSGDLLDTLFIDDFMEDTPDVQLAILTAIFKIYLVEGEEVQDILQRVILMATSKVDNPDVRERALMYFWLLSECPEVAESIISPEQKPVIEGTIIDVDKKLLKTLTTRIGTLAILYGKHPSDFTTSGTVSMSQEDIGVLQIGDQNDIPIVVNGKGEKKLEVRCVLQQIGGNNMLSLKITNFSENDEEITNVAFNKNVFCFEPGPTSLPQRIAAGASVAFTVTITRNEMQKVGAEPQPILEVAILSSKSGAVIFSVPVSIGSILVPKDVGGRVTKDEFVKTWASLPDECELSMEVDRARMDSLEIAKTKLRQHNLYFIAKRDHTGYFSGRTSNGEIAVVFVDFIGSGKIAIGIRMQNAEVSQVLIKLLCSLVK